MPWIDGHLDLAYLAVRGRDLRRPCPDSHEACVSLTSLREAGVEVALATIFTEPGATDDLDHHGYASSADLDRAEAAGRRQLDIYRELEAQDAVRIIEDRDGLDRHDGSSALKIVLLMEGADPIRTPDHVAEWFAWGLRVVGMTWAAGTRYAGGNVRRGPLTAQGVELVKAMDEVGIVHDASHLCDEAFEGLLAESRGPVVATHSNCRALVADRQRHLRDDQIREIGRRNGIVGLNLFSKFLVPEGRATIGDCVAHVQHVTEIMGHRRGVGLGSDMDGGFGPASLPAGLDHPGKLGALAEALRGAGWSDDDVEGFSHANWRRFLERALPGLEKSPGGMGQRS